MVESTGVPDEALRDGFPGQRLVVLATSTVRAALTRPVTNRLLVTDAGFFPHAARHGRSRPRGARENILLICTNGSGWVQLPETTTSIHRGDAVLISAQTPHEYAASATDPWTLWWLHFLGADASELVRTARAAAGGPISHLLDPAPLSSLVSQAIDGLDMATAGGLIRASGAAWNALAQLVATGRRTTGTQLSPVEQAVAHLRATVPQRTSVEALASMVGLSSSHFAALFQEQVGIAPLRYQNELRMARARELLDSTDLPVAVIAKECGYHDPLYFSRQFSKVHHQSPTAYRTRTR